MIRHEPLPKDAEISILRLYETYTTDPYAPYAGICTLVWEPPDAVWVNGFRSGSGVTRVMMREMLAFFLDSGVKTIKAKRSDSRALPGGVVMPDGHTEIDAVALAKRVGVR